MKRLLAILLCCLLTVGLLGGCGGEKTADTEAPVTTTAATEAPTTEAPETEAPTTEVPTTELPTTEAPETETVPETTEAPEDPDRNAFYETFHELDPEQTDAWLEANPDVFADGYAGIAVNEAWLTDSGLDLYTRNGHQVLAIDAANGILILRIWPAGSRGVMAIAKDPSRLHLCAAEHLGSVGEKIGSIAGRNNGLLAMTGSGFIDPNGGGNGGQLAGWCMCGGKTYGRPMGYNYARFELHSDDEAVIRRAYGAADAETTDAMEFEPALLIDGIIQDPGIWTGENPRAAIGQTWTGEILMVGVEGRFNDSPGCSVREVAKLMQQYGGRNAINVDGGTTAILWYRGQVIMRCSNRSTPDGRYLPNAWVYVKSN